MRPFVFVGAVILLAACSPRNWYEGIRIRQQIDQVGEPHSLQEGLPLYQEYEEERKRKM